MYVAIRDCAIYQAGWRTLEEGMHDLGVGTVELALARDLSVPHPALPEDEASLPLDSPDAARETAAVYGSRGLVIGALFIPTNLNAPSLAEELAWIAGALRAAELIGAKAVRIDAAMSGQRTLPVAERAALFAAACRDLLAATPGLTVPLAIENHGQQGNDPAWLRAVLSGLDPDRVGVTLDPANLWWAGLALEQVYEVVAELAPRTRWVHCKNLSIPPAHEKGQGDRFWQYARAVKPLYAGDLDLRRVLTLLADAGYRGALSVEEEALAEFSPNERPEVLRQDVALLTGLIAELDS